MTPLSRHRHGEFRRGLNTIKAAGSAGKRVLVILDDDATHQHPTMRAGLARHPRRFFHVTSTS